MITQYVEQGNGKISQNVLDDILNQVIDASKLVFQEYDTEEVWLSLTETVSNKIKEQNIINETKSFWDKYYL